MSATAHTDDPGKLAGRPLEEWNEAYSKVESYFHALRVRNKVLLGQLVALVLERAMKRSEAEAQRSATNGSRRYCKRRPPERRCFRRADDWRCCWPTCRGNGRTSSCARDRGRRSSS
jgi:hypothetical protein